MADLSENRKSPYSVACDRGPSYFPTTSTSSKRAGTPFVGRENSNSPDDVREREEWKMRRRAFGTPGDIVREQPKVDSFVQRFGNKPTPVMPEISLYPEVLDLRRRARDTADADGNIPVDAIAVLKENMTRLASEFQVAAGRYNELVGVYEPLPVGDTIAAGKGFLRGNPKKSDRPTQTYYFPTPLTDRCELGIDSSEGDGMMETIDRLDTLETKSELHLADDCPPSSRFTGRPWREPLRTPRLDVVRVRRNEVVSSGNGYSKSPREVGVRATNTRH
jgi:hypothetical protein